MSSAGFEPRLIGLDWGTTALRAYLLAADGTILDRRASPQGILHVEGGDFEGVLRAVIGGWLGPAPARLPVLLSGMITSRNGWVETPYVALPAGPAELAGSLTRKLLHDGVALHFITGATARDASGAPDVMRGEETEIAGLMAGGRAAGLVVMPGTHSKWVRLAAGQITAFETFMTGEVFAALRDATILGRLMQGAAAAPEVFARGVRAGVAAPGALLHRMFHARTLPLMGEIAETETAEYLSGLLIGSEIGAVGTGASGAVSADALGPVTVVGRSDLAARYATALSIAGATPETAPADLAAAGHLAIAQRAGLWEGA